MKQRPDPTVFREFIKFSRGLNAIFMQTAPGPAQTAFSQIYRPRHPPRSQTGKRKRRSHSSLSSSLSHTQIRFRKKESGSSLSCVSNERTMDEQLSANQITQIPSVI